MLSVITEPFIRIDPKTETEKIKKEIQIAVIDFNISHTYHASIVYLPKEKYELVTATMPMYYLDFETAIPSFKNAGVKVMQHPLETIKEIIVI